MSGDGRPDIVTVDQNANSVAVLLNNRRGGFVPAPDSPFAVGKSPYPLALGDVNGDRKLDIVVPNVASGSISVLLGDGRGGFAPAPRSPLAVEPKPYFVALGDLNGDGKLDILATHDDSSRVSILVGDGRGGFALAPASPFDAGLRGWKIALGDVNGDGMMDMAMGNGGSTVPVWLGDGRGAFSPASGSPFPAGRGPWDVALADVNNDGRLDLLTANHDEDSVAVLLRRP